MGCAGRTGSACWDSGAESSEAFQGSRSRPKAMMLTTATTALHAAKKSHPASARNESFKIMKVTIFRFRREAARVASRRGNQNSLAIARGSSFSARYCSGAAAGPWCMCCCMRASWLATNSFALVCWSGVRSWNS